jgi:PAS domain S-box-containing protein
MTIMGARAGFTMTENRWAAAIVAVTGAVLLVTLYCLSHGITIIFMHLYYIPIVLLSYHYRRTGFLLSVLLSITYFLLVAAFVHADLQETAGAAIRVMVFVGIAALVAYLSENLVTTQGELEKTVQIQQGIIQNADVWLTVLDTKGNVLVWNRAAEKISGFPAEAVTGRSDVWKALYPDPGYRKEVTGTITRIIADKTSADNFESEIRRKDGTARIISWNTRGMTDPGSGEQRYVSIGLDITERKTAEVELGVANARLRELDRLKSLFIASMSHELRTPLNSIIGFTGILIKGMAGELNAEQKKQLGMVQESARHLLALINDVIDISKIEAGKIEASVSRFSLAATMEEIRNSMAPAARDQKLSLTVEIPAGVTVTSDERRIRQIVMNLVSNAIKFTDRGEVRVAAAQAGDLIEIRVSDTGIGIGSEDLPRLFHPFVRIATPGRLTEGTGLGLYLSRRLALFLGGDLTATSRMNSGSEFVFTFPVTYKKQEEP